MFLTVKYGLENSFYVRSLENAERGQSAKVMYYAALMWLIIATVPFVQLIRTLLYRPNRLVRPDRTDFSRRHRSKRTTSSTAKKLVGHLDEYWTCLEDYLTHHWIDMSRVSKETSLISGERGTFTAYGTLRIEKTDNGKSRQASALLVFMAMCAPLLWVAQWLFWVGSIRLSSEEYVFAPMLTRVYPANQT